MGVKMLYIPLDDRPVNTNFVKELSKLCEVELEMPPREYLGRFMKRGNKGKIANWLLDARGDVLIDELANKYGINVAIHNHPKPSNYWNPDLFLEAVNGLSDHIGACADVGHWKRMGVNPVEGLRKYEDWLKSLHL